LIHAVSSRPNHASRASDLRNSAATAAGPSPKRLLNSRRSFNSKTSRRKGLQQLEWQPKGIDLLTDIRSGSYRELAEKLWQG